MVLMVMVYLMLLKFMLFGLVMCSTNRNFEVSVVLMVMVISLWGVWLVRVVVVRLIVIVFWVVNMIGFGSCFG